MYGIWQLLYSVQRSQSIKSKCTKRKSFKLTVLADFQATLTRSTIPLATKWATQQAEFDDVNYASAVSTTAPPPSLVYSLTQEVAETANSLDDGVYCHRITAEFQPATPEPWTSTSVGANYSLTVHVWAHSIPRRRRSRRGTGGTDGFTAWQIRIRIAGQTAIDRSVAISRSNCAL